MNVRELLRYEIWSKGTTRKILVVFGVVIASCFAWVTVYEHCISPGERKAGKDALVQIEAIKKIDTEKDKDFELGVQQAKQKIDTAKKAAWTSRDTFLALDLSMYLLTAEMDRKIPAVRERLLQGNATSSDSRQMLLETLKSVNTETNSQLSLRLHKELD